MFGYIVPMECELRVREQSLYRAYYCGLCKAIAKRYGHAARLSLSYDCAFLGLLLSAMTEEARPAAPCRCLVKPFRGKHPVMASSAALDYAADVNVLLAWHKLADDWRDERKLKALLGMPLLRGAFRKAERLRPALSSAIAGSLSALSALEKGGCETSDEPACAFGALMRELLSFAPGLTPADRAAGEWMFFNLGRWIYLADAWEDRARDAKAKTFNPFNQRNTGKDEASFLLYVSLSEAEKAYDLLSFPAGQGILDNIMHLGCRHRTRILLHGEHANESI